MIWWLRAHAVTAWVTGLVVCFAAAPVLAGSSVPTLAMFSGVSGSIPVPLVLPVMPACLLLYGLGCTSASGGSSHAASVRSTAAWRAGAVVCTGVVAVVVALGEAAWLDFPLGFAVARNLLGYLGVGLIVRQLLGVQYSAIAVAAVPLLCALIGPGPGGRPHGWMWPAQGSGEWSAALAAVVLFGVGMLATLRLPDRTESSRASP
ncbi:hypothetical protein DY218_14190 [Streptomyces triticagri]|uniref:Uncharacterized protein n=1 Tax=Streptomyces triticagri TaxID=2293568 RepID=A0A372M541_9ACTN|nr:hypothetical protein [Streptomyces triticagri]RFU86052.1 hypothetical protein DY218_14190 [Streptomyces triticagri]